MTEAIKSRLYAWIDRAAQQPQQDAELVRLQLSHMNAMDQAQPMGAFPINLEDESTIHEAKMECWLAAENTQQVWRGFQRFTLVAYYGDQEQPALFHPFAIGDDTSPNNMVLEGTEPANMVGMVKQQMRHNEVLAKVNAGMQADQQAMLMRQLSNANAEVEQIRTELYAQSQSRP